MLGKLLKYDLKWDYKVLGIFYLVAIVSCLVARGLQEISSTSIIVTFLSGFFTIVAYTSIIFVLINTFTRLITRFYRNLYKDEAYLTHTLPVEKSKIYSAKFLSSMICMATSVCIILVSFFILLYTPENMQALKQFLEGVAMAYETNIATFLILVGVAFVLEMTVLLLIVYTAIIIGHKAENNKVAKSVALGVAFFYITQIGILVFSFLVGIWNKEIVDIFVSLKVPSMETVKTILVIAGIAYALAVTVYYIVGNKQLKKGVNIE